VCVEEEEDGKVGRRGGCWSEAEEDERKELLGKFERSVKLKGSWPWGLDQLAKKRRRLL